MYLRLTLLLLIFNFYLVSQVDYDLLNKESDSTLQLSAFQKKDFKIFKNILKKRSRKNFKQRIIEIPFDLLFIEEFYDGIKRRYTKIEYYFLSGQKEAYKIFKNNKEIDVNEFYNPFFGRQKKIVEETQLKEKKINIYQSFQQFQSIDSIQLLVVPSFCTGNKSEKEVNKIKKRKTEFYQNQRRVYTMVSRKNNQILMSFQTPVIKPVFKILHYNKVWDF